MDAIKQTQIVAVLAHVANKEADYKDANFLRQVIQEQQAEIARLTALIAEQLIIYHEIKGGDPILAGKRNHPTDETGDKDYGTN